MALTTGFPGVAAALVGLGAFSSLVVFAGERSDRANPQLRAHRPEVRALREAFLAEQTHLIGS